MDETDPRRPPEPVDPFEPTGPPDEVLARRVGRDGRILDWQAAPSPDGEWELSLEFSPSPAGQLIPTKLTIEVGYQYRWNEPPEGGITARLLHALRIGELVDAFRAEYEGALAGEELLFGRHQRIPHAPPPEGNRRPPKGWGEAFYQDVAVSYVRAMRTDPRRPIQRMAQDHPGYTAANVRDWVSKARFLGYLTPSSRGRAAGAATRKLVAALEARGQRPSPATPGPS